MNKLIIIGAGGHGKVIADIALKNGYTNICFIDDNAIGEVLGFPIIGRTSDLPKLNDSATDFVIAIGNNKVRQDIAESYDVKWVTLVHPSAQIAVDVSIDTGTVIMANAVVNPSTKIGKHCIINTGAIVDHDNVIEDYVHISPRAVLGGVVYVGSLSHVGIGATVKNVITVCPNCVIGAGAVVVKNIVMSGTYVGVPAVKKSINLSAEQCLD